VSPYIADVAREEVVGQTYRVIPIEKATYVGQAVAAVLAESRYLAEDGADLVDIDWEILPAVFDPEEALKPGAPLVDENIPGNNFAHVEFSNGDVEAAFAKADRVVSKRFAHGRYSAAPLEGRAVVADYSDETGEITMWDSTQSPHVVRTAIAGPLGIAESKIRVISDFVGGGFGLKAHIYVEEAIIPALSRMAGRPVKWIEDRYEHLAASLHSKDVICYLEAAVQDDGTILAFRGRYVGAQGGTQAYPFTSLVDPIPAACVLPGLYDIEAVAYEVDSPLTNKCTTGSYRGIGWTPGHTFREVLVDDIARELGMDPLELRLKNTIGNEPYVSLTNMKYDGGSYKEAQLKAAEMLGYEELRERQRQLREQGRYIGIGWSPYVECAGWGQYISTINGFPDGYFDAARVTMEPDGTVNLSTGMHNHGQAHATTFAQLAADHLGIRMEDIKVTWGDTARDIYGMGTYGSRSALIGGGAIIRATKEVRDKLARMAAHALEVRPEDIEISQGMAESGAIAGPAAVINAVADALSPFGVSIERMPVKPSYVRGLITDAMQRDGAGAL
jgi:carbon-monoxide dehydrogenase large subunit